MTLIWGLDIMVFNKVFRHYKHQVLNDINQIFSDMYQNTLLFFKKLYLSIYYLVYLIQRHIDTSQNTDRIAIQL